MIVRYIFLILNYSGLFRSSLQRCSYKSCSKTKQQIYRRTPVLKCDSNKVALQCWFAILLKLHFSIGFFLVNLLYIFRTSFLKNTCEGLLLFIVPNPFQVSSPYLYALKTSDDYVLKPETSLLQLQLPHLDCISALLIKLSITEKIYLVCLKFFR